MAHPLALNTLKGLRGMLELRDGTRKNDKQFIHSHKFAFNQPQVGQYNVGAPSVLEQATSNLKLIRLITARTQGKPSPSPISYILHLSTRPPSKWFFVPKFPKGSPEIVKVETPATLRGYNFMLRPPIGMRFKAKLYFSSRAFQQHVARHLHTQKSG